jgi:uncharacterized protein (DUF1697 family)
VGLLRGINIGPHHRIAMSDLRSWVADLGHTDVTTYIASGNVVFSSGADDDGVLAAGIEARIAAETGLRIPVLVRSHGELADAVRNNPFPAADARRLLVGFLDAAPPSDALAGLRDIESGRDEHRLVGRTIYLHLPDGQGRSVLAAAVVKALGRSGTLTTRNLSTVRKLVELSAPR